MTEQTINIPTTGFPDSPDFRPQGSKHVVVSRSFLEGLYTACANKPCRPIILASLSRAGFDTDILGFCLDETIYAALVNLGKPMDDLTLVWRNVSPRGHAEVDQEYRSGQLSLEDLVMTGLFRYIGAGISLMPNFEEELLKKYPGQSIEEGLQKAGIHPEDVGASRILRLKKRFDDLLRRKASVPENQTDPDQADDVVTEDSAADSYCDGEEAGMTVNPFSAQMTDEELIATGKFVKSMKGIAFSRDFERELYAKFPEVSIDEGLRAAGLSVENVGINRVSRLRYKFRALDGRNPDLFTGMAEEGQWQYSPETVSRYQEHPYIKECSESRMELTEDFYDQAAFMGSLSMEEIFSSFSIEPGLFSYAERNKIHQMLEGRPLIPMAEPSLDQMASYQDLMLEILYNRAMALCRSLEEELRSIAQDLPNMLGSRKRELFSILSSGPKDPGGLYNTSFFIKALGVARSSFYSLAKEGTDGTSKLCREEQEEKDAAAIRRVFEYKGYAKGARQIYMMLPEMEHVHMGLEKIRRLMNKYGIHCDVRKPNPARQRGRLIQSRAKENLIQRKFRLYRPNQVRLTDVTYITLKDGKRAYGSAFLDPVTSKVICFNCSENNNLDLVKETLRLSKEDPAVQGGIVHTDQGVLYLSLDYQAEIEEMGLVHSMSKRGNCVDNAPMESFWGHFKDEVDLESLTYGKLSITLQDYVFYYNTERRLWGKEHMTPMEYEKYLTEMTDEEFERYLAREKVKYEEMKKTAAEKAMDRAKTLGVDGIYVEVTEG